MGFGDWRNSKQTTWEWIKLKDGFAIYEQMERMAICLESGVPREQAAQIAWEQVNVEPRYRP